MDRPSRAAGVVTAVPSAACRRRVGLRTSALVSLVLAWNGAAAADGPPDFARQGWPFLKNYCIDCHGGGQPEAELSLEGFRDAASLVKGRTALDRVLRMVQSGDMPPPDAEDRPSAAEIAEFTREVQAVLDHHDRTAPPDPGRVTMRRLNRAEYRNTVRDLMGIDFDPTEDFPADDIGHGFDNIGDVLTLPPVLMERYLSAAEAIVAAAIVPRPPRPPKRVLAARYSEPASADVGAKAMEGDFRRLATDGATDLETGPINTPYTWEPAGEYIFRIRVYARSQLPEVPVAVLVQGKDLPDPSPEDELARLSGTVLRPARILKVFTVKADTPERADVLEVRVPPMPGRHRMMVANFRPAQGQSPVRLYVQHLVLEGPSDTRPASHRRLLAVLPDRPREEQTREVLTRFLRRAYRRVPTPAEVARLAQLADAAVADGQAWEAAMQLAMQAALCSPKFLFRMELDDRPHSPASRPLDEFQLASRLSYFLWSTMPDDELLDLAERGQLTGQLDAQVRRMLVDEKSSALVENFALQWLQVQRLASVAPDEKLFPSFNDRLRRAMLQETILFFQSVMREDRSVLDLIGADYTFLNEPLARHYGIADTHGNRSGGRPRRPGGQPIRGETFQRVSLQDGVRGGVLTQASVLTVTSNPTRTSPVKRGRWVLEQVLGEPPPAPPPDVPELPEGEQAAAQGSLRQRLEMHRRNSGCANCHMKMDAIGFALENFDAVGAFRTKDGEFDIDAAGEFSDGSRFVGPEELKAFVKERTHPFTRCLAEKMLIYALGRGLEYYDRRAVEQVVGAVEANDYRFSALVGAVVRSDPFRLRRGSQE